MRKRSIQAEHTTTDLTVEEKGEKVIGSELRPAQGLITETSHQRHRIVAPNMCAFRASCVRIVSIASAAELFHGLQVPGERFRKPPCRLWSSGPVLLFIHC